MPLYTLSINLLLGLFALCICIKTDAAEKVVLQLKWEHEFQFAGYYAAQWQGYYDQEGLEVEIRSHARADGTVVSPLEEINSGRADFAIGGADIFVSAGKGNDLKVLAPIFQRSPGAIYALRTQTPFTIEQASLMRFAALSTDDTWLEARAMFFIQGIDSHRLQFLDKPVSPDTLVAGEADAVATYSVSAEFRAAELGVKLVSLHPSDYGIQFYGDTLYTSGKLTRERPELAEKFLRATLKGWQYALNNRTEIAERISNSLPRYIYQYDNFQQYNLNFARQIDNFLFSPAVEIGHVDLSRWQRTYDALERLGEIAQPFDPASLLFHSPPEQTSPYDKGLSVCMGLVFLLLLVLFFSWRNRHYRRAQVALLALLLLLEQGLEAWHQHDAKAQQSIRTVENLATIRSKLEQVLYRNLAELTGVAAFIAANPDVTQSEFEDYASAILKQDPQLINLAAAPGLIVKYIHPLPGNEAVLGLNYRLNTQQMPAITRAIEQNETLIAGPVNLVQGGMAFISRAPVRITARNGTPTLWGIVSAPIDVASVYREAGLLDTDLGMKIAIRGQDGKGAKGEVFYGSQETFSHPDAVTQTISFSGGSWQVAAVPMSNDTASTPRLILIRFFFLLLASLLLLLLAARRNTLINREHYHAVLRNNAEFMREVETVAKVGGWRMTSKDLISDLSRQTQVQLHLDTTVTQIPIAAFAEKFAPTDRMDLAAQLREALVNNECIDQEMRSRDYNDWFRLIAHPLMDDNGHCELIGALQDITEKKNADAKIERQATYDSLTDLPNRALFYDRLETAIKRAQRNNGSIAVLFVDIDHFKAVNDNYGHREGDSVLQESARRIQSCLRESDTVARHSGDEFTIILYDLQRGTYVDRVAEELLQAFSAGFKIGASEIFCGVSIGIALYPGDASNAEELIVNADQAMYEVKKSGRNGWHFYTEEMQRRSEIRHHLFNDLVTAIRDDELSVHLQPIVSTQTGQTVACEALVRWQRADGSWLSPGEFIPLAEETGLINQIDYLVMKKSSDALVRINSQFNCAIILSINVSPRLFQTKDQALNRWMDLVRQASQAIPISVEITERLLIDESNRASQALNDLAKLDVGIAIDDFGTGYSSLSYLTRFPVTTLKIDHSFVWGIGATPACESLIETILAMASKLDLKVVAEGVETQAQLDYLTQLQCHCVQGYYLGKPASIAEFEARIQAETQRLNRA